MCCYVFWESYSAISKLTASILVSVADHPQNFYNVKLSILKKQTSILVFPFKHFIELLTSSTQFVSCNLWVVSICYTRSVSRWLTRYSTLPFLTKSCTKWYITYIYILRPAYHSMEWKHFQCFRTFCGAIGTGRSESCSGKYLTPDADTELNEPKIYASIHSSVSKPIALVLNIFDRVPKSFRDRIAGEYKYKARR